jgi:hypothetical protein
MGRAFSNPLHEVVFKRRMNEIPRRVACDTFSPHAAVQSQGLIPLSRNFALHCFCTSIFANPSRSFAVLT